MHPKFQIYTDISSLPISEHEAYQEEGFCGICTGGTAVIEVFSVRSPISENDIVTILPLQLVSIREVSDDFSMTFFKVDKEMFLDIMSGLGKITPDFFFYMRKNFLYSVNDVDRNRSQGQQRRSRFPAGDHSAPAADLLLGFLCPFPADDERQEAPFREYQQGKYRHAVRHAGRRTPQNALGGRFLCR